MNSLQRLHFEVILACDEWCWCLCAVWNTEQQQWCW